MKCDEGRPSCQRCILSKSVDSCGGYDDQVTASRSADLIALLPKPISSLRKTLLNSSTDLDSYDARHLDFFRRHTIKDLPGSELGLPWSNIILSRCSEPTVSRAVAALGCIHRALLDGSPSQTISPNSSGNPFAMYHKAINALQKLIADTHKSNITVGAARKTTLIVTLMLFCFEVLCGQNNLALKHLEGAFSLVQSDAKMPTGHSSNTATSDVLKQIFSRLSSDWLIGGQFYYDSGLLQTLRIGSLPAHFHSHRDASLHMDAICEKANLLVPYLCEEVKKRYEWRRDENEACRSHECAHFCWTMSMSRVVARFEKPAGFGERVDVITTAMSGWRAAFTSVSEANPDSTENILLEIQFLQSWLSLRLIEDHDQTLSDTLADEFERAISLAERYVSQKSVSATDKSHSVRGTECLPYLGSNIATCVCMVIDHCRDYNIRWRSIRLLSESGFCGITDTSYIVAYSTHMATLEASHAQAIRGRAVALPSYQDVPTEARFMLTGMCWCPRNEAPHEFYKGDSGRMVYVRANAWGKLEVGESRFEIDRTNQRSGKSSIRIQ